MDLQTFAFFLAKRKHTLAPFYVTFLANHAVIFGTETLAQFLALAIPEVKPGHDADQKHKGNRDQNDFRSLVHDSVLSERSTFADQIRRMERGLHTDRL